jgi:PBP1b-binding outer membrane lipoprotein LpoB
MRLIIRVLAAAWLLSGCVSTPPNENSPGAEDRDARGDVRGRNAAAV